MFDEGPQLQPTFIKKEFTLGKTERLKSRKTIEQLFASRQSFNSFPYRVFYVFVETAPASLQAGFGVSTKNFKKAVDRNRVKRLGREAYRLQKNDLQNILADRNLQLAIFFIFSGKELPNYALVQNKIETSVQRLIKLVNEKSASNS